jgi:hypothetical protein
MSKQTTGEFMRALRSDIIFERTQEAPRPYERIKCLTCQGFLGGKAELKRHMGHEVHYTDKSGKVVDE